MILQLDFFTINTQPNHQLISFGTLLKGFLVRPETCMIWILLEPPCYLPTELSKCLTSRSIHDLVKPWLGEHRQRISGNLFTVCWCTASTDEMWHRLEFTPRHQLKSLARLEAEAIGRYIDLRDSTGA